MFSKFNNNKIYDDSDIKLKTPFTMNIIGPSRCGKTSLVSDLLENKDTIMSPAPRKIIYCYSTIVQMRCIFVSYVVVNGRNIKKSKII